MQWHLALHMHGDIALNGCECMVGKSTVFLCSIVCREYMVDRHYVWCSMVGLVKWDNVQNESHGFIKEKGNEKYVCWV